jgi:two-component system response regulator GlrR
MGLWRHFLQMETGAVGEWTPELAEALLLHSWPDNIRELKKLAQRTARIASHSEPMDLNLLPAAMQEALRSRVLDDVEGSPTREQLEKLLRTTGGNVKLAAERNGWHRTQLYRWLRRAGIDPESYR